MVYIIKVMRRMESRIKHACSRAYVPTFGDTPLAVCGYGYSHTSSHVESTGFAESLLRRLIAAVVSSISDLGERIQTWRTLSVDIRLYCSFHFGIVLYALIDTFTRFLASSLDIGFILRYLRHRIQEQKTSTPMDSCHKFLNDMCRMVNFSGGYVLLQ